MAPERATFLTLLDHNIIVAELAGNLFGPVETLDIDVNHSCEVLPRTVRAGNALAQTCRRTNEALAPALYRSICIRTWSDDTRSNAKSVVNGLSPLARRCVKTLETFVHAEADLDSLWSFLFTLPRLEHLMIDGQDFISDASSAVRCESTDGAVIAPTLRHLTLRFSDLDSLTWILFKGQAAERLRTLHLCWEVPRLPGVLPNVQHLSVALADNGPLTDALPVTRCLPALERVYVSLEHGFWADIGHIQLWAADFLRLVLVYIETVFDYIPYVCRHDLDDSSKDYHLSSPLDSTEIRGPWRTGLNTNTAIIFLWLKTGPQVQEQPPEPAYFVLRYEYKTTNHRWDKSLKVYPWSEMNPDWTTWDDWEMARNAWDQLGRIEAREVS